MSSMDLDDLDLPVQAPVKRKPSRFLTKSSNQILVPKPEPRESGDVITNGMVKKEEEITKPVIEELAEVSADPPSTSATNGVAPMEVDEAKDDLKKVDEDEDFVVREIDVYFTPSADANAQISLFQYPLRPCWRPYDLNERCDEVRVKPDGLEVEIDLSIDVHSKNFDPLWTSKMGQNKVFNQQTLSSTWKPPCTAGYAIGIFTGNKLHLSPIHATLQLRPSLELFKAGKSARDNSVESDFGSKVKLEEPDQKKSIRSSKKQNKPTELLNEQSTTGNEGWVELTYHSSDSDSSARYIQTLITEESSPIDFSMNPCNYITSLCPETSHDKSSKVRLIRFLLTLPLEDRLKKWLFEGDTQVHRFNSLKYLAPDVENADLFALLRKYAIVVQGLWVIKSEFVFGPDEGNQSLIRDYLLFLFSQNSRVNQSEIGKLEEAVKKRKFTHNKKNQKLDYVEILKSIISTFAVQRHELHDWKFKEPTDAKFIDSFSVFVKEQQDIWEKVGKQLVEIIGIDKINNKNTIAASMPGRSVNSDKGAVKNATGSHTMSDEIREALPKAMESIFKSHPVCRFQTICDILRNLDIPILKTLKEESKQFLISINGANAPMEELETIISKVASNVHGVYISKSSPHYPEYNAFRRIVINLYIARGIDARLKKADVIEAARAGLKREVPNTEYSKVLNELCESNRSSWVLKIPKVPTN